MKSIFVAVMAAFVVLAAQPGSAAPITVNFGSVPGSVDVTAWSNPAGFTVDGVTFLYSTGLDASECTPPADPDGWTLPERCSEVGAVDLGGFNAFTSDPGGLVGALALTFASPVTSLELAFEQFLLEPPPDEEEFGLTAIFGNGEDVSLNALAIFDADLMSLSGLLAHSSEQPFSDVTLLFSPRAFQSFVYSVDYTPVPEPGSMLLLGTGMVGLARLLRRKR